MSIIIDVRQRSLLVSDIDFEFLDLKSMLKWLPLLSLICMLAYYLLVKGKQKQIKFLCIFLETRVCSILIYF